MASMSSLCGNLASGLNNISLSLGLGNMDGFAEEVVEEGESRGMGVVMSVMVSLDGCGMYMVRVVGGYNIKIQPELHSF